MCIGGGGKFSRMEAGKRGNAENRDSASLRRHDQAGERKKQLFKKERRSSASIWNVTRDEAPAAPFLAVAY